MSKVLEAMKWQHKTQNEQKQTVTSFQCSPNDELCELLDRDIDRPAEFPERTFAAWSLPRILKLIGWFQLLRTRRARVRGKSESKESLRAIPSSSSGMSMNILIVKTKAKKTVKTYRSWWLSLHRFEAQRQTFSSTQRTFHSRGLCSQDKWRTTKILVAVERT